MNAIGYLRLSMRDQSRYSLEYQESSVREYCARHSIELMTIFKDNGQCSDNFDRPDYIALENFIKKHKGAVNYLIVMDHDRFSRNLPEALMKIKMLEKKLKIKVLATNEAPDLDTNDPDVFMNRAFKYLMANNELLRIRQRTSRGIRQALEGGRFVNLAPFGYNNLKEEGKKGIIVLDETKAPIIRKIFIQFLLGHSITEIFREAKAAGFTVKSKSAISRLLNNCVYAGLVKVPASSTMPEKFIKGIHSPVISVADYWRCQAMLNKRKRIRSVPDDEVFLRGLVRHDCGSSMTAGYSKGKTKYYLYYRCIKCSHVNVSGQKMHDTFDRILELLNFTKEQVEYITNQIKNKLEDILHSRKALVKNKTEDLVVVNKKIDGLEEKFMNAEIESTTYRKWYKKFMIERSTLQSDIQEMQKDQGGQLQEIERLLPSLLDLSGIFKKATIFQKHSIIREVFKAGLIWGGGSFRTPWLNKALSHNQLVLNEKGLLLVEQSLENLELSPMCSENEI